jgi:hypothetical protein
MAKKRAGYEKILYRGAAGSTAATQVTPNVIDITFGVKPEFHGTTTRGNGTGLPRETEQPHSLKVEGGFTMVFKDGDAHMAAFLAAAENATPTPVAIKILNYTGGDTEFDGDVYLEYDANGELAEGQEVEFTMHPTDDGGRDWATS